MVLQNLELKRFFAEQSHMPENCKTAASYSDSILNNPFSNFDIFKRKFNIFKNLFANKLNLVKIRVPKRCGFSD